jgi:hypothetical protein
MWTLRALGDWLSLSVLCVVARVLAAVSTIAGFGATNGTNGGYADGVGTNAVFNSPTAVALDTSGNVFCADWQNDRIRKVSVTGMVSTFVGSGGTIFADGTGTGATLQSPKGIAFDASGNIVVGDTDNNRVRRITPAGMVMTIAGKSNNFADGMVMT